MDKAEENLGDLPDAVGLVRVFGYFVLVILMHYSVLSVVLYAHW